MTLKKKYLTLFYLTLAEADTGSLAEARIRDSIAKEVLANLKDFEKDRQKIHLEYCIRNEKDEPELTPEGLFKFKIGEVFDKVKAEVATLEGEEVDLKVKDTVKVKELIEGTKYKPKVGETEIIDELIALI